MEILVCILIIGVLVSITFAGVSRVRDYAAMSNEVSAGRSLINAYLAYPAEHNGVFMPGHDVNVTKVRFKDRDVTGEPARRYPFRLAPYFDYQLDGTIFVNGSDEGIKETMGGISDYMISLLPAMGININHIGGDVGASGVISPNLRADVVTRQSEVRAPIVVFVSASLGRAGGNNSSKVPGNFKVLAPNSWSGNWTFNSWKENSNPANYGYVDFRHGNKAVCAFLDGSVKTMTTDELRDMRLWSTQAFLNGDPYYVPGSQ